MFGIILSYIVSALCWVSKTIWRGFEGFADISERLLVTFGVTLLVGMWGLLLLNAISRWTDWFYIGWSLEIVGFMLVWSIFIIAAPVSRWNAHISVSLIPDKLLGERRGTAYMSAVESFAGLALCIFITIHGYRFIDHTYHLDWKVTSVAGWDYPLWIIRSGILIGFFFCSVYYFERTVNWTIKFVKFFMREESIGNESPSKETMAQSMKK